MVQDFRTAPAQYKHWRLEVDGDIATLTMAVDPEGGQRSDYELKLNSYDLGVDIELADAIQRLRFEQPQVRTCVVTGGLDRVFCAGANINMLSTSPHGFKVNFCKYTNETRCGIEDASANSNVRFLAALNGTASGGGYELALACDKILLVDDRNSAVSFPELPLLGVLPGTGGLTRIADKRKIRRDRTDVFSTLAEGIKGKRAVEWDLVDRIAPLSKWSESVSAMARELADELPDASGNQGIDLTRLEYTEAGQGRSYEYVELTIADDGRTAHLTVNLPAEVGPKTAAEAHAAGASWWVFQAFREVDDALCHLRMNLPEVAVVLLRVVGSIDVALGADALLADSHWFTVEVRNFVKRVLKRQDNTAKSFYAIADQGTAFAGLFLEMALAADRIYLLNDPELPVQMGISGTANGGLFPMSNGISRLETRFLGDETAPARILEHQGAIDAETADELGLATSAPDEIDWDDEIRLAIEERTAYSPDALTGMEANLRFAGPETMETKIFGRLTAWQNWIFQRPNAVGERGALKCYGTPQAPEFDYKRT
ncbi:2,3-epoxybenzoyl-CoA dihydrolase [Engelhardtia mirabilis]|uniref:Benzoyl-CoA-dihydrodiol lyase n=1 Tax=Engelhardtia mirabilis TaxID=2528011 RepID=A0A518BJL0_9BACT|nr:Benzoyl-CoA-dihydrodiol lyase [Planctomycetes bacterium Pla133]QDV01450.1 Benzoyl-CoA-dihydrodiol lyase [Planctomycetes bacterium Pla86]